MTTKREIALARLEAAIDKRIDAVENHVAESIDFYKNEADAETVKLAKRVYALEKAIQNQDDTIQNEDAFKVGDRVTVHKCEDEISFDLNTTGVVTAVDREDTAYPYLVDCGDDGDFRCIAAELRTVSPSTPFPATGNTPVAETFKVGDRIVVAHAAYKKYAGRMGCVSSVGHTAQGVVQYSVDFDGEDCTVYFFPADELRHADSDEPKLGLGRTYDDGYANGFQSGSELYAGADVTPVQEALDVDVTAYAGVIHTNASGERFHVIPEGDFLESEHWRHAFNVEERENLDLRQEVKEAKAFSAKMAGEADDQELRAYKAEAQLKEANDRIAEGVNHIVKGMDALHAANARADRNSLVARGLARRVAQARFHRRVMAALGQGDYETTVRERDEARETAHDLAVELEKAEETNREYRDANVRSRDRAEDAERQLAETLGSYREEVTRLRQERDNLITEARDMDQLEARLADAQQERNELRSQVIELRVQLQRARSSQRIDPARAGLSRMSPFTYCRASAEPAGVTRVTDSYGDVWVRDADGSWSGDVGAIHEGYQDSWDDVLDQYGPLTEVQK